MNYLIRTTSSGIVQIEAGTYLKAVSKLRNAGVIGMELVGAFQPYRGEITQLTLVGDNFLSQETGLKAAVERYAAASVARSWPGSKDAESHAEIEEELSEARNLLKQLLGFEVAEFPCSSSSAGQQQSTTKASS